MISDKHQMDYNEIHVDITAPINVDKVPIVRAINSALRRGLGKEAKILINIPLNKTAPVKLLKDLNKYPFFINGFSYTVGTIVLSNNKDEQTNRIIDMLSDGTAKIISATIRSPENSFSDLPAVVNFNQVRAWRSVVISLDMSEIQNNINKMFGNLPIHAKVLPNGSSPLMMTYDMDKGAITEGAMPDEGRGPFSSLLSQLFNSLEDIVVEIKYTAVYKDQK